MCLNGTNRFASLSPYTLTNISQTKPDVWTIEDVFQAVGAGVLVTQRLSYVQGENVFDLQWNIVNTGSVGYADCCWIFGGDLAVGGADSSAWGYYNTLGMVQHNVGGSPTETFSMYGLRSSREDRYVFCDLTAVNNGFASGWLSNTYNYASSDGAAALQWNAAVLPAGSNWMIRARIRLQDRGSMGIVLAPPDTQTVFAGQTCSNVFWLDNEGAQAANYDLSLVSNASFDCQILGPSQVTVDSRCMSNIWVAMTIPPEWTAGQQAQVRLVAVENGCLVNSNADVWSATVIGVGSFGLLGVNGAEIADGEPASLEKGTDFGMLNGCTLTNRLVITNSGANLLNITGIATNGPDAAHFTVQSCPATVAPGEAAELVIVCAPTMSGILTAAVHIAHNGANTASPFAVNLSAADEPYAVIELLGANGAALSNGAAADTASGTDFGTHLWNAGHTNVFAVTNAGYTDLNLTDWSLTGAGAGAFVLAGQPSVLAPGTKAEFSVAFYPGEGGIFTGALTITHDAPSAPFVVNISGAAWRVLPESGPQVGGNLVALTNGAFSGMITGIVVGAAETTNIIEQSANWVRFIAPSNVPGLYDIRLCSTGGVAVYSNAYTYHPSGSIAGAGASRWKALGTKPVPGQVTAIGMNNSVYGLSYYGGMLYAGGAFTNAGGSNVFRVARYDGTNWNAMGLGIRQFANANCILASSNGSVYAGGYFTNIGGINSKAVARWDGTNWTAMGEGLFFAPKVNGYVNTLAQMTNGDIVAGGYFTNTSYQFKVNYVARWNGNAWTNMNTGFSNVVNTLSCGSDGSLYAGGSFTNANNFLRRYIAKWNGNAWTNVGSDWLGNRLTCMAAGSNGVIYAGGWFTNIGTLSARYIAKWDPAKQAWTNMGIGFNNWVYAIKVAPNGDVYAGGSFTNSGARATYRVAKWNPADNTWTNLGSGMNDSVLALDTDENNNLYASGFFKLAGGSNCWYVAKWESAPGTGISPDAGPCAGGFDVTITGSNLCNGADVTNVTICGVSAGVISQSATQIVVTAGAALAAGIGDVRVYSTSYGETVRANGFTYNGPGMAVFGTNGVVIANNSPASADKGTDFGAVSYGRAMTNFFAVTNVGNEPLIISAVATNGTGAGAFQAGNYPTNLMPGSGAVVRVVFSPATVQAYTASVAFANNQPDSPFLLNLCGVGMKTAQTISFPALSDQVSTNTTPLSATASSGLPVTFEVVSGPAVLSGLSNLVYSASGAVVVRAIQTGNVDYAAAVPVSNVFSVIKAQQAAIVFNPGAFLTYGSTIGLAAGGGSGTGSFSYAVESGDAEVNSGTNLTATSGVGDVVVAATKAADDLYAVAFANARLTLVKAAQTPLVFNPASPQSSGTTNGLVTSGGSGSGTVAYAVLGGPGTIVGSTNLVVTGGVGQVTIRATKDADACYLAASTTGLVMAGKAAQIITFTPIGDQYWTNQVGLSAVSDSGLQVSFRVAATSPAVIYGATNLSFTGLGNVSVIAEQPGNANFAYAAATQSFAALGPQLIWLDAFGSQITNHAAPETTNGTDFGTIYNFSAGTNWFMLTNAGTAAWQLEAIATNLSAAFALSSFPTSLAVGATGGFAAVFAPVSAGAQTAAFAVADNTVEAPFIFNVRGVSADPRLDIFGTNGAALVNNAAADQTSGTDFGNVRIGESVVHRLLLTNAGSVALLAEWTKTGAAADRFSVEAATNFAAQSSDDVLLAFTPTTIGVQTAAVTIVNNSTNTPFLINLQGTAIDPQIALIGADGTVRGDNAAPDVAFGNDFGMVLTGNAAVVTLTITNPGQTELFINDPVLAGLDSEAFSVSNLPLTVAAETAEEFTLHFHPPTLGAHSFVLALTNNSTGAVFRINAAGLGAKPGEIGLNRGTVSFSGVYGGADPAPQSYILTNKGMLGFTYTNTLTYRSGADGWLELGVYTGDLAGGAVQATTGTVSMAGLNAGIYQATNTITSPDASNAPVEMLFELTVERAAQSITFDPIAEQFSTNSVALHAVSDSGLPVSFSVWSGPAQITDGTNLSFTGAGQARIVATQAGNSNYAAATEVTNSIDIVKSGQAELIFAPVSPQPYGSNQTLTASGGSGGGAITYTLVDGPGKVQDDVLSLLAGSGVVTVMVTKAADVMYLAQTATALVECAQSSQTINFDNPGAQLSSNRTGLAASASSGLPVEFAVISGPAMLDGTNLTYYATGLVSIQACQTGNLNYAAAVPVTQSFTVARSVQSDFYFEPLSPQTYGATNTLLTFGGSGTGAVSYALIAGAATLEDDRLALHSGTGTVRVAAYKAQDDCYFAAGMTAEVACARAEQVITFPPLQNQVVTGTLELAATASSELPVAFAVLSGPAELSDATLTFTAAGTVVVRALQPGDDRFDAAQPVTNVFDVSRIDQAPLYFTPDSPQTYGTTNPLSATGGSGTGALAYAVISGPGEIAENSLIITSGVGTVVVSATKAADGSNYSATVTATVVCAKAGQTIVFTPIPDQAVTGAVALEASASSLLPATFSVLSGSAEINDGSNLTFQAAGAVAILAQQGGNENYLAAPDVTNSFNVGKVDQQPMTFNPETPQAYGQTFALSAEGGSGEGELVYALLSGSGELVNQTWCKITSGTGTVRLSATKGGDLCYNPQTVTAVVACAKADQAINFAPIPDQGVNRTVRLNALTDSGAPVSNFSVAGGPGIITGQVYLSFANTGLVYVVAQQPGNANLNPSAPVTNVVNVVPAGAIAWNTNRLDYTAFYQGTNPGLQMLVISNVGQYAFDFSNHTHYGVCSNWLTVLPATGRLEAGAALVLTAAVESIALPAGLHLATNSIFAHDATNSPQNIVMALAISKATAAVHLADLTQIYDGAFKTATATTDPGGLHVAFTYDGQIVPPSNAGVYAVTGIVEDINYTGSANSCLTVNKAVAGVFLDNLHHVYDNTAKSASATTMPAGLTVNITYDGAATPPKAAGSYAITGTVVAANYQGITNALMTIARSAQTIAITAIPIQTATATVSLAASASSGLTPVTFKVQSGPGRLISANELSFSAAGDVLIMAAQAGDGNWSNAVAYCTVTVIKATSGVGLVLTNLTHIYDGAAKQASALTTPSGLPVVLTYDGSPTAPSNAGGHAVTGVIDHIVYAGTNSAVLTIGKGDPTLSFPPLGDQYINRTGVLAATSSSGLPVTNFSVLSGPAVLTSATELVFSDTGTVFVVATDDGNANWNPASATNSFFVHNVLIWVAGTNGQLVATNDTPTLAKGTDFGRIGVGTVWTNVFLIGNEGTTNLEVSGWTTNGAGADCFSVLEMETNIAPGDIAHIVVAFAPTNLNGSDSVLEIEHNGSVNSPFTLYLYGTGVPPAQIAFDVAEINLASAYGANPENQVFALTNLGGADSVFSANVEPGAAWLTVTPETGWLTGNSAAALTTSVSVAGLNAGPYHGTVTVFAAVASNSPQSLAVNLTITQAQAQVLIKDLFHVYDGVAKEVVLETVPTGLTCLATYNGAATLPSNAGVYVVTASVSEVNYQGFNVATLTVQQAQAQVSLKKLSQPYNGTARAIAIETSPTGLAEVITYDGLLWAPTNAGSYAVTGTVVDINYTGFASGTLTVSKNLAGIYFGSLAHIYDGTGKAASVTTMPAGLVVTLTYDGNTDLPVNAGNYDVVGAITNEQNYSAENYAILTINKGAQAITNFTPADGAGFVTTNIVGLAAQSASGLPIFFARHSGPGIISGGTTLTFTGSGLVAVMAAQTGNSNWHAALEITNVYCITKAQQANLLFNPVSPQGYCATNPLSLSGGSGTGAVSFVVLAGPGRIVALSNIVIDASSGNVEIAAIKAADIMFLQAAVTANIECTKGHQIIVFPTVPDQFVTSIVHLAASASSELPISYQIVSGPGAISYNNMLTFSATGVVRVAADQVGDAFWFEAQSVTQSVRVLPYGFGALGVLLVPAEAVAAGAQWRVDDGSWRVSGSVIAGLVAGEHAVSFSVVPGYTNPANRVVTVNAGQLAAIEGVYTLLAGDTRYAVVAADFDGDSLADPAVFCPLTGNWHARLSKNRYDWAHMGRIFGNSGYAPLAADFDGDRLADPTVYNPATGDWDVKFSTGGYLKLTAANLLGRTGFAAAAGDLDGDGLADPFVCDMATGQCMALLSGLGYGRVQTPLSFLGHPAWLLALADYDGDRLADPAAYDPASGDLVVRLSGSGYEKITLPGFLAQER